MLRQIIISIGSLKISKDFITRYRLWDNWQNMRWIYTSSILVALYFGVKMFGLIGKAISKIGDVVTGNLDTVSLGFSGGALLSDWSFVRSATYKYIFLFLLTKDIKSPIVDVSTIGENMNLSRLISILHNQKNSYMNVQLKEFGLSHGQAITLKIIYEENNIKQEDLNKRLQIDKSAVTRILKTLEDKGFIIKKTSKEDKRNHVLSLTSKGKELYPKIKDVIKETTEMMIKDIDQNELILLEELLLKMKMNLEDTYEK